jgi:hypothetical protein
MTPKTFQAALLLTTILPALTAFASVVDESTAGDFSDNRLAPTLVRLGSGVSTLRGRFGVSPTVDVADLDYVTIEVPPTHRLDRMMLSSAFAGGAFSFVGIEAGPIISIPANWTNINTPLLGWAHFGSATVGQDMLELMRNTPGSVGFTPPLAAGLYTLWIMELDTSEAYSYEFQLCVEPSCAGDSTGDGTIDGSDLSSLLGGWGGTVPSGSDLDGNGVLDGGDLALLLANWGPCSS